MFSYENNRKIKLFIIKSVLWLTAVLFCFYLIVDINADESGFSPIQEVKFSHKVHSGKFQMKCLSCHYSAENSAFSNIPTTYDCMVCHIALKNEKESLKKVVESYYNKTQLTWKRINQLPDHSHFNHSKHINAAVDCSTCHGKVEEMDSVYSVRNFTMGWCLDCHKNPKNTIILARDISGIYINREINFDSLEFELKSKSINHYSTTPFIGGYSKEFKKIDFVADTKCSGCHY